MKTLFYHADFITMDTQFPHASAVLCENGRVEKVLDAAEAGLFGKRTDIRKTDLNGITVYPGLIDSHLHILSFANTRRGLCLDGIKSRTQLLEKIGERAASMPDGSLLEARGFNEDLWEDRRLITKDELDAVAPRTAVRIIRICGHLAVANSRALALSGITSATPAPEGGTIDFRHGVITENGLNLLFSVRPDEGYEACAKLLKEGLTAARAAGLTTVYSDDLGAAGFSADTVLRAYETLVRQNAMPVRVVEQCALEKDTELEAFHRKGYHYHWGGEFFRIGPRKLYADGSLGARTAWLRAPYADKTDTRGVPIYTQAALNERAKTAHLHGMPFIVHAIGDAAAESVLNAIEYARMSVPGTDTLPDGIVHCQITPPDTLDRIVRTGAHVYAQPVFIEYDWKICQSRAGKALEKTSYAWKTLFERNVCISSGSDCPVETLEPLRNIYCACFRKDYDGKPENGWNPRECLSAEEAIACHTLKAAETAGLSDELGCIKPGALCDMTGLAKPLKGMSPAEMLNARPVCTVIGGEYTDLRAF